MLLHESLVPLTLLVVVYRPMTLHGRRVAPLMEDDWARRPHRATECTFGKQIRELGSTWHPDLGPPFGIMFCIKCECIPIQKKKRIIARVQCRNIKNECPKLTCDEPVLLPGRCCKSCPNEYNADIVQDLPAQLSLEEEERSLKQFGTLLTGRTSQILKRDDFGKKSTTTSSFDVVSNYIATGRFTFHRKNLYYSFAFTAMTPRPRILQFLDVTGNILEEQTLDPIGGVYQNATGKLCGVWRRVARDYRKLLKEERLFVSLTWETTSSLNGRLSRYRALSTEQFSSLLEPSLGVDRAAMSGSGATAIVSATSFISTPSVHISLIFNGLFLPNDIVDVPIVVQLEHAEKNHIVLREEILVKKPSNEINSGEVRGTITVTDLRLLSRGKLTISIMSKKDPEALKLSGAVSPRVSCDMYQALLTSDVGTASGLGWAFLDRYGAMRYGFEVLGMENQYPVALTLIDESGKKKLEVEDLTPSLIGGVANGTLERPGPRLLEPLLNGDLAVVVSSLQQTGSSLKGRLVARPVADARDTAGPVLLRRVDQKDANPVPVGLVWASVDPDCTLHYEVEISGLPNDQDTRGLRLYLETMPALAQGAPVSRRLLEEFTGSVLEGSVAGLLPVELYRIESGIGFLEVTNNQSSKLLKAPFKTRAPLSCLPHYADNDVASVVAYNLQPPQSDLEVTACFHETRFYEEGTQWTSSSDPCSMCHCRRGLAHCDPVPCPVLQCAIGKQMKAPGNCCPICSVSKLNDDNTTIALTKGCTLAGQFHLAGSSWHPYLPPNGFDTCALCTCDIMTLQVRCPRVQCPPLDCDEKDAFRPEKKACCRQCPILNVTYANGTEAQLPRDQAAISIRRTSEEILASGGCKYPIGGPYENGKEWHPRIHSHGEAKCVKCRCKNGDIRCDRKRCPRSVCNSIVHQIRRGERPANLDDCCAYQCRRARRHHRNNHHSSSKHAVALRGLS